MQNTHFRSPISKHSQLPAPLKVVFPSISLKLRHPSPPSPHKPSLRSRSTLKQSSPSRSHLYLPSTGKSLAAKVYDFALGQVRVLSRGRGALLEQYGKGFELLRKLSGQPRKKSASESSESSLDCDRAKSALKRKQSSLSVECKTPNPKRSSPVQQAHARKGWEGYLAPVKFAAKAVDDVNDVRQSLYRPRKPSFRLA